MASSDMEVPSLPPLGSDQVMLSLLSKMADPSSRRDHDDSDKRTNNSDRKFVEPNLQLRTS
jgi:hypothetical protein